MSATRQTTSTKYFKIGVPVAVMRKRIVREYRFYTKTKDGRIEGPPTDYALPYDASALKEAKQFINGHAVEIWQGARIVAHLDPQG
jgi:hypothetical protein